MNADVERCEVQAEHLRAHDHVGKPSFGNPAPAMRAQCGLERAEIDEQRVSVRVAVVCEPTPDAHQLGAVRLGRVGRELWRRTDEVRGHPPRLAEPADLTLVQLAREQASALERLLDGGGAGVRVAVHVAADPGAEAERNHDARQVAPKLPGQLRHGVPEARLEEPQPVPDLVNDARPPCADLVGLPEDRDLLGERVLDLRRARGRESRVVEFAQEGDNPSVSSEHGPACRLGRVSRHNRRDVGGGERGRELVIADPGRPQSLDRVAQRLERNATLVLVLAPATQPVMLFGDVRELEEEREGPQYRALRRNVEPSDSRRKLFRWPRTTTDASRERADPFFQFEELRPLLLYEHAPEQIAE